MRIAVSGAHRTGKTTLVEELARATAYEVVDEPYHLLEEEGFAFSELPSVEEFEAQLERSIASILDSLDDRLHDRCPADFLAYLLANPEPRAFDLDAWLPAARGAMQRLDLVVFVPIEEPDRITAMDAEDAEDAALRRRVDEELRVGLLDDGWDFAIDVVEVVGSTRDRARQVLARLPKRPT